MTAICLALLLAAIGYRAVADDRQDPMPPATRAAAPDSPHPVPKASPGDNGTVRVVEQGFSPVKGSSGDDLVSYGAILENTSRRMAAVVALSLRTVDAQRKSLVGRVSEYALKHGVTMIEFPPGASRHITRIRYGPPAGVDLSKVELYPLPEVISPSDGR